MSDLSYVRKQIFENCRMLFDQEVKIITLLRHHQSPQTQVKNCAYTAIVLPKACPLKLIAQCDTEKILLQSEYHSDYSAAMWDLLKATERKMGQIFVPSPSNDGSPYQIDKTAIYSMCNIMVPNDTRMEQVEAKVGSDKKIEDTVFHASNKRIEEVTAQEGNTWGIVEYAPSGEPYIKEHEPEDPNAGNSFSSSTRNHTFTDVAGNRLSLEDSRTDLTPETLVISDSSTVTPSLNDEHSPTGYAKRLEEANAEVARLRKCLEEANWEIGTLEGDLVAARRDMRDLEQRLLGAESRCKEQEEQIEVYEVRKKQSEITTESMSNEITSLKEAVLVIQRSKDTEKRYRERRLARAEQAIDNIVLGLRDL